MNYPNKDDINSLFESIVDEEAPANSAGSGNIAGIGVGPQGEPGVTPNAMAKYKKSGKILKRFKDTIPLTNNRG
jgi:hypothetical protein